MERLRYVARAGGGDAVAIVAETVDALVGLRPAPGELLTVCRNLLDRHPACGPLWWLAARLLADPAQLADAWTLVHELAEDPTPEHVAAALPDDATVVAVGHPRLVAEALGERPDVSVLAVDADGLGARLARVLDRSGVVTDVVAPEAILAATRSADVVLVEADACSAVTVVAAMGNGLAAVAAGDAGTPVWLVAGRGRRLPERYVDTIAARVAGRWDREYEVFSPACVTKVVCSEGVRDSAPDAFAPDCPLIPEL